MNEWLSSPLFGLVLCILTYWTGTVVNRLTKSPLANPLLIAILLVIGFLSLTGIPPASFALGGDVIAMFLAPATASLALSIYRQSALLKKNLIPLLAGCTVGSLTSMGSVYLLCRLFRLEDTLTLSLLPKSVTTPIAMAVSEQLGGIPSVTVAAVILTGILGAICAPWMIRLFRVHSPVAEGVAIGACSHAVGTSKALELGEAQGAMSGIAIGLSGVLTVLFAVLIG